ncbi:MAG: 4Fe-4S ferredoxin [Gemmatimonadales bacterium]
MSMERLSPVVVRTVRRLLAVFRLRFDPEPDVCPTSAIVPDELEWPRTVRRAFSDVTAKHESTGIHGRGTEEVKTNDVTNRVAVGDVGLTVELGRPGVGVWFRDVQHVAQALARGGVRFEDKNPVTSLMADPSTGKLNPEILNEKVMSVIIEFGITMDRVSEILALLKNVAGEIPTTMAIGIATRCDEFGNTELDRILAENGYHALRAKTNIGLGRSAVPAVALSSEENR